MVSGLPLTWGLQRAYRAGQGQGPSFFFGRSGEAAASGEAMAASTCQAGTTDGAFVCWVPRATVCRYNNVHASRYVYIQTCLCMHIYMYMYISHSYTYIYMGNGISPPAFCDISKSHEPRQFRVKGLGYMSLGFRLPNFPISQTSQSAISQFPKSCWPIWAGIIWEIGKLANGLRYRFPNFPISQIIPAQMSQHALGNWEMA